MSPPPQHPSQHIPNESRETPEAVPTIRGFVLGPFETNTYIVSVPGRPGCWIVDPSFDPQPVIDRVLADALEPRAIVLTHAHVDHIAGVADVIRAFAPARLPVWIHAHETAWLNDPVLNLSAMTGMDITAPGPDRILHDADILDLEGTSWRVLHTPGHSPGGVTLHHAPSAQAIVGDTLFNASVGRSDFPGSDPATLANSIRTRLYTLPDATRIFPGHGPASTIGRERRSNPFVRG
jgi:glyoxylase-like metal-dependent hydrolase (beta-lactamase superfamily II)